MRPTRWHRLRLVLALLVVVLVSTWPQAMILSAASAPSAAAHHHGGSPSAPQHEHLPADCCCGLCSAGCLACGGIAYSELLAFRSAETVRHLGQSGRGTQVAPTSFRHRLPPPIGPPS